MYFFNLNLTRLVPLRLRISFSRETWPRHPAAKNTKLQTETQEETTYNSHAAKFTLRGELPYESKREISESQ